MVTEVPALQKTERIPLKRHVNLVLKKALFQEHDQILRTESKGK
jgi:hypothetical protein